MAVLKLKGDYIFDGQNFLPKNTMLIVDNKGSIIDIVNDNTHADNVKYFNGILCPAFINTHCHLELSYLQNKIAQHIGLLNFLLEVITKRHIFFDEKATEKIAFEINTLYDNGIIAVGDICNTPLTFTHKKHSPLHYHNFIECIGFDEHYNEKKMSMFTDVFNEAQLYDNTYIQSALSPHSPYSFSSAMFNALSPFINNKIVSMHNQECQDENDFFMYKTGAFLNFYHQLNIPINFFNPTNKTSLQSVINYFKNVQHLILVHNLYIQAQDFEMIKTMPFETFFCVCINANLYINNVMPNLDLWMKHTDNIVIGTDSLASNHTLNILDELKTIKQYFPHIATKTLLQWATYNSAKALNKHHTIGLLKKNYASGIVYLSHINDKEITQQTMLKRIC